MKPRIEFAPLNVPLRRRAQTAAVLCTILVPLMLAFLLYLLLTQDLLVRCYSRELLLFYVIWALTLDRSTPYRGGRIIQSARRLRLWKVAADYFPIRLHVTQKLDPSKRYVFGVHPHGIISLSVVFGLLLDVLKPNHALGGIDYRIATVTANTILPIWREVLMACGFVNAHRSSLSWCLEHGLSVMTVIGGAMESLYARPGRADLTLEERKGFVKLALKHGADLVPVYNFGETELYDQLPNEPGSRTRAIQDWMLRNAGWTTPFAHGRGVFNYSYGLLPRRVELNIVVGAPIEMPCIPEPSQEEVDHWHSVYVSVLKKLYDDAAPRFFPRQFVASVEGTKGGAAGDDTRLASPVPPLRIVR